MRQDYIRYCNMKRNYYRFRVNMLPGPRLRARFNGMKYIKQKVVKKYGEITEKIFKDKKEEETHSSAG